MGYTTIYKLTHPKTSEVFYVGATTSALQVEINELVAAAIRHREGEVYDKIRDVLDENLRPYIDMVCQEKIGPSELPSRIEKVKQSLMPQPIKEEPIEEAPKPKPRRRPSRKKTSPGDEQVD